jgi:hypothetical protein
MSMASPSVSITSTTGLPAARNIWQARGVGSRPARIQPEGRHDCIAATRFACADS